MGSKTVVKQVLITAAPAQRRVFRFWNKHLRRFSLSRRFFKISFLIVAIRWLLRGKPHPTTFRAPPNLLRVPRLGEGVLKYAHKHARDHNLPVYIFYKARSGQLNNQLISFFNALTIAKESNAVLVAPFAFYGSESYIDFAKSRGFFYRLYEAYDLYVYQRVLKCLGLFYRHDELIGDYLDGTLLNKTQPVVSIMQFLRSPGADYLRTFPHVLARKGDAPFYYMSLGKRNMFDSNVNMRGQASESDPNSALLSPSSRRELDCNFNASDYFRGLPYFAGVNGNFLFLSRLYRSHSLNCTASNPYWLELRKYVQPRVEIRRLVDQYLAQWGSVMSVHLRLFPFDLGKFSRSMFCQHLLERFEKHIKQSEAIYVAYSVSSVDSVAIISELRTRLKGKRIVTAEDFGSLKARGPVFNKRYAVPLLDMWVCVKSDYFVGRLGSSLSWNVAYWREALSATKSRTTHEFYELKEFSEKGQSNPTDSYGF